MKQICIVLCIVLTSMMLHHEASAQVYNFQCEALTHLAASNTPAGGGGGAAAPSDGECGTNLPAGTPAKGSTADQDNTYLDMCLNKKEVQGTRPQNCAAHKSTRTKSVLDFSPWYLISLQQPHFAGTAGNPPEYRPPLGFQKFPDTTDPNEDMGWCTGTLQAYCQNYPPESLTATARHPYLGKLYRGESNTDVYSNRLTQIDPADTVNSCIPMLLPNSGSPDPYDPYWMRAELDNCANQYILARARYARRAFEQQGALPMVGEKAESLCQPLRLIPVKDEDVEYIPSDYIQAAWRKLLVNPGYTMRNYSSTFITTDVEPNYARTQVSIYGPNAIQPPTQGSSPFRCSPSSSQPFGQICTNGLVEQQVERIFDPSHPFSPRWDFNYNERDYYSWLTVAYYGNPLYQVRCAGNTGDKYLKVDVMSWRASNFNWPILRKIAINIVCYYLKFWWFWCWTWIGCQSNTNGGDSGSNSSGQCCATNWGGRDVWGWLGGLLCGTGRNNIKNLCAYLRKNVVPINTLKMRKSTIHNFPRGVPEGYKFTDYFGNHLPYIRCWDTGKECGTHATSPDPLSSQGSKIAIVGVGRETQSCRIGGGKGQASARTSVNFNGRYDPKILLESYMDVMNGSGTGIIQDIYDAAQLKDRMRKTDPITSWSELKLYQARSARETGLNCLAKHELVFKQGTGEDIILGRAGAQYTRLVCDKSGDASCGSADVLRQNREKMMPWPLGWRGYVSDPTENKRFPNAGIGIGGFNVGDMLSSYINNDLIGDIDTGERAPGIIGDGQGGLDYALVGDTLIYDEDVTGTRNPYIAYVTETSNLSSGSGGSGDWVKAMAFNHGKYLDVCGNTDAWGKGEEYTMYKGNVPPDIEDGLKAITPTNVTYNASCDDPKLSSCVENLWDRVKLYFPGDDYRGLSANAVYQVVGDLF